MEKYPSRKSKTNILCSSSSDGKTKMVDRKMTYFNVPSLLWVLGFLWKFTDLLISHDSLSF